MENPGHTTPLPTTTSSRMLEPSSVAGQSIMVSIGAFMLVFIPLAMFCPPRSILPLFCGVISGVSMFFFFRWFVNGRPRLFITHLWSYLLSNKQLTHRYGRRDRAFTE